MSIFLHYIKKDDVFSVQPVEHPRAKFSIKIRNQLEGEDVQHEIYDFHSFAESNGEWGWKDFAEIDRLFEEGSGLLVDDLLKVELSVFVQPKAAPLWPVKEEEETKTVVVQLLTDSRIKREVGKLYFSGLPLFHEGKSFCLYEQMRYSHLEDLVSRDLRLRPDELRFWLCEQLTDGHVRIVQNLAAAKTPLNRISDLAALKEDLLPSMTDLQNLQSIQLYVETPANGETLTELKSEKDFVAFCKYYDPWEMELCYLGSLPLRRGCTPAEVIVDARMLAGIEANTAVSLYVEAPPSREAVHELQLEDSLDTVGVKPGCTVIVQPRVDAAYAKGKEMQHPTVGSFLQDSERPPCPPASSTSSQSSLTRTEPHDDNCVVCFSRPRTVGFLHGKSLHRCVCQECAPHIVKNDTGRCPICRAAIDRVILNIF